LKIFNQLSMNFKRIFLVAAMFLLHNSQAQEGIAVYTDYLSDNYYLIHPSMAGAANCAKVRITGRQQWFDQTDAPALQTLSFNTHLGEQSGIGVIAFNDQNGYHSQSGAKLTYAHHIMFSRGYADLNMLSFGMSGGLVQSKLDQTKFEKYKFDPVINQGVELRDSYFNIDLGASYHYLDFYAHATIKNFLANKRELYSSVETDNLKKYILSAGYTFSNGDGFMWEPSVMFQAVDETDEKSIDLNIKAYKEIQDGKLWGGLSYRRSFDGAQYFKDGSVGDQKLQYFSPLVGINYKKFMLAYTYTYVAGKVNFDTSGFHQITLGFDIFCRDSQYSCNCPAVN